MKKFTLEYCQTRHHEILVELDKMEELRDKEERSFTEDEVKKYRSLIDEEGFMWHESDQFATHADLEETKAEIEAQIDRLTALGLDPSHLDNHMGSLYGVDTGRFELLLATLETAGKRGLPFRFPTKFKPEQIAPSIEKAEAVLAAARKA